MAKKTVKKLAPGQSDQWFLLSMGMFIGLIVDGADVAVAYRVTNDKMFDDNTCARTMQVVLLPNGHVMEEAIQIGCTEIHRILEALIEAEQVR